jgi:deoxyribodipyrimidine photo-lyase
VERQQINIVWLKRDLRTQDHAALHAAEKVGLPYLIIALFEPMLDTYQDTSMRHLQFRYHSLIEMNAILEKRGRTVEVLFGEAQEIFVTLIDQFHVKNVFSYQESGTQITWNRDKRVQTILNEYNVEWVQFPRDGIMRGIKNRDGWDKRCPKMQLTILIVVNYKFLFNIHFISQQT